MRVSYFNYEFKDRSSGQIHRRGLRDLFQKFCNYDNIQFKNSFLKDGENLYLLKLGINLFGFVHTRSKEIINKIDRANLTHTDIYQLLLQHEGLGFMSYAYVDSGCLAFGSTQLAPRVQAFADFVNRILNSTRTANHVFELRAFLHESSRAEVMRMGFVGKTIVQVESGNTLYESFKNLLGGEVQDYNDIDSFEIILKPKRQKNIKPAVVNLFDRVPDAHLRKLLVNAKEDTGQRMQELYLAGKGHLSDRINPKSRSMESDICAAMQANEYLQQKQQEHNNEQQATLIAPAFIHTLDDSAWTNGVYDI